MNCIMFFFLFSEEKPDLFQYKKTNSFCSDEFCRSVFYVSIYNTGLYKAHLCLEYELDRIGNISGTCSSEIHTFCLLGVLNKH